MKRPEQRVKSFAGRVKTPKMRLTASQKKDRVIREVFNAFKPK